MKKEEGSSCSKADLTLAEIEKSRIFFPITSIKSENQYKTKNWNFEKAIRYVFSIEGYILEASIFFHFLDDRYVKTAIELPVSYGCNIGCRHCASSMLKDFFKLSTAHILKMVEYIISDVNFPTSDEVLITFSGIGEGAFSESTIRKVSRQILSMLPKAYFTYTTFGINRKFISFCDNLSFELPTHYLQISYLHHDIEELIRIVPRVKELKYDFFKLLEAIRNVKNIKIRINYVMINNYNDSVKHCNDFVDLFACVKTKITIRISQLNCTESSTKAGIKPTSVERLLFFDEFLKERGFESYTFFSGKNDNMNCGQLAWKYDKD